MNGGRESPVPAVTKPQTWHRQNTRSYGYAVKLLFCGNPIWPRINSNPASPASKTISGSLSRNRQDARDPRLGHWMERWAKGGDCLFFWTFADIHKEAAISRTQRVRSQAVVGCSQTHTHDHSKANYSMANKKSRKRQRGGKTDEPEPVFPAEEEVPALPDEDEVKPSKAKKLKVKHDQQQQKQKQQQTVQATSAEAPAAQASKQQKKKPSKKAAASGAASGSSAEVSTAVNMAKWVESIHSAPSFFNPFIGGDAPSSSGHDLWLSWNLFMFRILA